MIWLPQSEQYGFLFVHKWAYKLENNISTEKWVHVGMGKASLVAQW